MHGHGWRKRYLPRHATLTRVAWPGKWKLCTSARDEEVFSEVRFSFKSFTRYTSQNGGYTIKRHSPACLDAKAGTSTWHSIGCSVQSSNWKKASQQSREIQKLNDTLFFTNLLILTLFITWVLGSSKSPFLTWQITSHNTSKPLARKKKKGCIGQLNFDTIFCEFY